MVEILAQKSRDAIEFLKSKGIENVTKENYKDYYEDPMIIIIKRTLKDLKLLKIFICVVDNNLLTTIMKIRRQNC